MKIGAQLYTVREFCKDLTSFSETLKKVADMGYQYIQVSGTCEYNPQWLSDNLNANGLKCVLTHIPADKLINDTENVIKAHKVFECDNIGLGYNNFAENDTPNENYERFLSVYKPVARRITAGGKYFMYHNHDNEFIKLNIQTILDKLAYDFTADEMGFTLDTFWIQAGGADPAYYIEKLSGRVPCIHLKDYAYGRKMAVIGEGNINFDRVFEKAENAGTEYMLVEQDDCGGENPFDCLKRSYDFLKSCGF